MPYGFIHGQMEIKFLILYVASRLIEPVPFEVLQDLTMCDDGIDFFDFSDCLTQLVNSEHLSISENEQYAITEKGMRNGKACESNIPYSVRVRADKSITVYNQKLRRQSQVKSEIIPQDNGTFSVILSFTDHDDAPLMKMELIVPKEVMAQDLAARFQKKPEQIYNGLINSLFDEPNE